MNTEVLFAQFPVLGSGNLVLKKVESDDLECVYEIYSNDRVFQFCGITPKSNIETVKNMIVHFERDFNKQIRIKWGIFAHGRLVGIIEAFDFNKKINMVTIGYFLAESYWGKGIATKALALLVDFLINKATVNRIQAEVMPGNEPSKRILIKNGFTKEGTLRQAALWTGKGIVDLEIYSLLKEEYAN